MKLKEFTRVSEHQEQDWTCGHYSLFNAIRTKANMRKLDLRYLDVDDIIKIWNDNKQGFLLPLINSVRRFEGKNIGGLEIYNLFKTDSKIETIKQLIDNLVTPILAIQFKGRGRHNEKMTYTKGLGSGQPDKFHIVTAVDIEGDWILLNDSAYSDYAYIHKDDISIIKDVCYFNVKNYDAPLIYPLSDVYMTQAFGVNKETYKQFGGYWATIGHQGEDYRAKIGTQVFACHNGVIKKAKYNKYSGNTIELSGDGYTTVYGHLSQMNFKVGESIKQGNIIGLSGNTGDFTTAPHLHVELWMDSKPISLSYKIKQNAK